ncbi:MAG: hypothetical protein ACREL1_04125 [bacterium]
METAEKTLGDLLPMMGVFWAEKKRWPLHAAELQAFAFAFKKPLDLSGFHRLGFQSFPSGQLWVNFTELPEENLWIENQTPRWLPRGRVEIRFSPEAGETDALCLKTRMVSLPAEFVEWKSYCALAGEGSRK